MNLEECATLLKAIPSTDWTKYVPLLAVIVGPVLQWKSARRKAAPNISAKQQTWIDELQKNRLSL